MRSALGKRNLQNVADIPSALIAHRSLPVTASTTCERFTHGAHRSSMPTRHGCSRIEERRQRDIGLQWFPTAELDCGVSIKPDVIFALGGDVAPLVRAATRTIPTVTAVSVDP